jgi:cytochrome c biogenesis protein CcdA
MRNALAPAISEAARANQRATRRGVLAWTAVAVTLAAAVLAALQGSADGGLTLGVVTLAGSATDGLQGLGEVIPFGYAVGVGMASAVNPCGAALLPAYLGLYLGTATHEARPWPAQIGRALLVSTTMSGSFIALFGVAGMFLGLAGAVIGGLLPWLSVAVGGLLVVAGGRVLAGRRLPAAPAERLADRVGRATGHASLLGYAVYGLAFALSSLGCTLPLFLAVVGAGFARGGFVAGFEELVLYALGMAVVVSTLTVLVAVLGRGVLTHLRSAGWVLEPFSAVLLLGTGGYIVYYWLSTGGILG